MTLTGAPRLGFKERQIARAFEFCAVYVVHAPEAAEQPMKLAVAAHPEKRMSDLQTGCWLELAVFRLYWFEGKPLATRVHNEAEHYLSRERAIGRLKSDWFAGPPALAANLVEKAALAMNIRWFDEAERRRRIAGEVEARIDRAAFGIYEGAGPSSTLRAQPMDRGIAVGKLKPPVKPTRGL